MAEAGGDAAARFGITVGVGPEIPRFASWCEQHGYDYVASGEHIVFTRPTSNAFVALAAAAAATSSIKLLSSATLLPLYPPALAAKMTLALDAVSSGRFELGIGIGGEFPLEFEACGVPIRQRGARADEGIEVVRRLLRQENVTVEGKYSRFRDLTLLPRPVTGGGPPIWVTGRSRKAMDRAARSGDGWLPYMYTPEQVSESRAHIIDQLGAHERPSDAVRIGVFAFAMVDHDARAAKRIAAEVVGRNYNQDFTRLGDKYLIAGSPADCIRRIAEYRDAGANTFILGTACPPGDVETLAATFADQVIPAFGSS